MVFDKTQAWLYLIGWQKHGYCFTYKLNTGSLVIK